VLVFVVQECNFCCLGRSRHRDQGYATLTAKSIEAVSVEIDAEPVDLLALMTASPISLAIEG
jgi:hypothetical protein